VSEFQYWGEIPQEQMQEVNRVAASGGWRAALLESSDTSVLRASKMILDLDRANWHWLLDLPPNSHVLDIGAGTGTNSHALALRFQAVTAVEPVLERVQFMQQRFAQEKLNHINIVRTSLWSLPFPEQSMDLIAMNGVLEWVAEGKEGDPGELQIQALRRLVRLLRPGGYLYLGIENRFCLGYFVGHPDPHCGIPFVTVLPRFAANWYARRKGAHGYRNYLYSSRGYRQLLEKVGLSAIDLYAAIPSYNDPRFLVPLAKREFSHYAKSFDPSLNKTALLRGVRTALLKTNLLPHLSFAFAIIARK
jgi:SAM-dependent methyltransferase